jgi:hypothetical protein
MLALNNHLIYSVVKLQGTPAKHKQGENNMLTLNGKKFAKDENEMQNSLFNTGGTCVGYYRVNKKSITIMDHQKKKVGVICNTVLGSARKVEGIWHYFYMTPDIVGKYPSYIAERKELEGITRKYSLPAKY